MCDEKELSRLRVEVKFLRERVGYMREDVEDRWKRLIAERDEARAEVERLREMAHDFEAMRQDRDNHANALKQERREVERLQGDVWALTTTLRSLPVPSPSLMDACTQAYKRGAEAMREASMGAAWHSSAMALHKKIKDLPIPEDKP